MRTNGILQVLESSNSASFDKNGEPIEAVNGSNWSSPIPCSIKTVKHHHKGTYEDGGFTVSSYEILMEVGEFEAARIKLEKGGKSLGEFAVQDIQELSSVGRIKIIV